MQEIEKIRTEVDQIHGELASLFQRRLVLARRIWEIKKSAGVPFINALREKEIIHRFDSLSNDDFEKTAVQNFFKAILLESKQYLENTLK